MNIELVEVTGEAPRVRTPSGSSSSPASRSPSHDDSDDGRGSNEASNGGTGVTVEVDIAVGKAGLGSAVFNTTNTVLGGGALSLPFVCDSITAVLSLFVKLQFVALLVGSERGRFAKIGLGLGVILVTVMALVAAYTGWLLTVTSMQVFGRPSTYAMLSIKAISPTFGPKFTDISILIFQICTLTSYVIILGDCANNLLNELFDFKLPFALITALIMGLILIPLNSLRRMSALKFTSFVAVGLIAFLVCSLTFRSLQYVANHPDDLKRVVMVEDNLASGLFISIPILAFAYTFHLSIFPVWGELSDRTTKTVNRSVFTAISIALVVYLSVAVFGNLRFYNRAPDNVLTGFKGDALFLCVTIGYWFVIAFSYPVIGYIARVALNELFFPKLREGEELSAKRLILQAAIIGGSTWLLAVIVPAITIVFGFTGATVGVLLSYIFPAYFYVMLYDNHEVIYVTAKGQSTDKPRETDLSQRRPIGFYFTWQKMIAMLVIVMALLLAVLGTLQVTIETIHMFSNK